jgi:hypothetical protein
MRIDNGDNETNCLWLDLTPAEAAELRDALLAWDGIAHAEAEWHIHIYDEDRILTVTVGNDPRNVEDPT